MRKRVITFMFIFILFSIFINPVWAKYVIEENITVATIQIDRTSPVLQVSYSIQELTSENVEVTINANEQIQEVDGWTLQEDKRTLKKEYIKNVQEEIEVMDLAGNLTKTSIKINNIDKETPTVTVEKILNSNTEYPNYANKDGEITFTIIIKDDRKIVKSLEEKDIQLLVNNKEIIPNKKQIIIEKDTDEEKIILLTVSGIEEEGNLSLKILKDIVKDEMNNTNLELEKDTQIQIDNTKPNATYSQEKIENGKIEATITANEQVRKLDGWNLENNTILKKIFNNNLSYTTTIQDLAGNKSDMEINIIDATNIILSYASHNSMVGWSYGYGNYDIAGLNAIRRNPKFKTESLAFNISGDVEKDYLQARAYIYTYWGENSKAICKDTKKVYSYGWNPSESEWKYENEETKVNLNGTTYFQLGGAGINAEYNTDINGNNRIPSAISVQYLYGISALQLKLKSYEENSICYQVYVDSIGWLKPAKNGELTCYQETKPISAIRVALVPNTEVDALMNTWEKDTRKDYLKYLIQKLKTIDIIIIINI